MKNEVMRYRGEIADSKEPRDCYIEVFSSGDPRFIKITSEQKEKLTKILLETDVKFVKIGTKLINVLTIKEIDFDSNYSSGVL